MKSISYRQITIIFCLILIVHFLILSPRINELQFLNDLYQARKIKPKHNIKSKVDIESLNVTLLQLPFESKLSQEKDSVNLKAWGGKISDIMTELQYVTEQYSLKISALTIDLIQKQVLLRVDL